MKRLFFAVALCGALTFTAAPVMLTGCAGTHQQAAYKTISAVGLSADAAFKSYLDLVISGKVKADGLTKVSTAYNTFQAARVAAINIAQNNPNATAPDNLTVLLSGLTVAIAEVSGGVK